MRDTGYEVLSSEGQVVGTLWKSGPYLLEEIRLGNKFKELEIRITFLSQEKLQILLGIWL